MTTDNEYSASPFYLWATTVGRTFFAGEDEEVQTALNATIADLGERIGDHLASGYLSRDAMDPQLTLSIMDVAELADRLLELEDPRGYLVRVWEALMELHSAVQRDGSSEVLNQSELILRTYALLTEADLPPELRMYEAIMATEWANFDWGRLEQLDNGLAADMRCLHDGWQDELMAPFRAE